MITSTNWGQLENGDQIKLFTLQNKLGTAVTIAEYGATIVKVLFKDLDVVLGYDTLDEYINGKGYFGCIVGRYANRIANGKCKIEHQEIILKQNSGQNSLHGGTEGFSKKKWAGHIVDNKLEMQYISEDGEEGYPGTLSCKVMYELSENHELSMEYHAQTSKTTVVNICNHSYFNLHGGIGDILDTKIKIHAESYLPVNEHMIPTGEVASVKNTPFDFLEPRTLGERINEDHEQLHLGSGYDHCFALNKKNKELELAAEAFDAASGIHMTVYTSEPGMQLYTANHVRNVKGKEGKVYDKRVAFCLETQHFPDAPNQSAFKSTLLKPGEKYMSRTEYRFS